MYLQDLERVRVGEEISPAMHGGNFVATANSAEVNDPFFNVSKAISLTSIRFPGGDLTERHLSPSGNLWDQWVASRETTIRMPDGRQIAALTSFLERASEEQLQISFVVPTEGLLIRHPDGNFTINQDAVDKVTDLLEDMISGRYGPLDIRQVEIGNEYYLDERMTASEYGLVTNKLVNAIHTTFETYSEGANGHYFDEPDIVVQSAPPWQTGENQTIIDSLDESAREAIDGLIIHWYPRNLDRIGTLDQSFSSIDEWEHAEGFSNLDLHVTEWNVFNGPQADTGLYQASTLLEGYERLATFEVDSADIWGVEFRRLMTGLARPNESGDQESESDNFSLTPAGEIIRSIYQTTPGLHNLDLDPKDVIKNSNEIGDENVNYTLTSFGDHERAVVYLGSRANHGVSAEFDQGNYFSGAHYVVVQTFSAHDDPTTVVDESIPDRAPYVQIQTLSYTSEEFNNLHVNLDPGEIVRIEYIFGAVGVSLEGQVGSSNLGINYNDTFFGTGYGDTLTGNGGNDSIQGNRGQDLIFGGAGDDTLRGGHQSDFVEGGSGSDRISGDANDDVLIGNAGDDTINGGNDDDLIFGGDGSNDLRGGDGDDTLISTGNDDTLDGGRGADLYSLSTTDSAIIVGWSSEHGDLISFQGQYTDPEDVRKRIVEVTYDDGRPGDLVIEHDGGTRTTIIGAAGQQESFIASLFDNKPLGENTLSQAEILSSLTPNQVGALTGALNTEEYAAYRQTIDPTLLAQNLDGERLAHFLNGLGGADSYRFINDIPELSRHELLEEMQGEDLNSLFSELDYESTIALLGSIDIDKFRGLSLSFDDSTREHIEDMLGRFASDVDEHDQHPDDSALSDISSVLLPPEGNEVPPSSGNSEEDPDDGTDGNQAPQPVTAGCFVATAVYADPNHPDVWLLRWFRDEILRNYGVGRAFIIGYWYIGPRLAETVSRHALLVRVFYILVRMSVSLICIWFKRHPGRQLDHRDHSSSRLIRIGSAAISFRKKREAS